MSVVTFCDLPLHNQFDLPKIDSSKKSNSFSLPDFFFSLLGKEGSYTLLGVNVHFKNRYSYIKETGFNLLFKNVWHFLARVGPFASIHSLAHEMGHALVAKAFGLEAEVVIYSDVNSGIGGLTRVPEQQVASLEKWKYSLLFAAGPLLHMAFCVTKVALFRFVVNVKQPALQFLIATKWIFNEIMYAFASGASESLLGGASFFAICLTQCVALNALGIESVSILDLCVSCLLNLTLDNSWKGGDFGRIIKHSFQDYMVASVSLITLANLSVAIANR